MNLAGVFATVMLCALGCDAARDWNNERIDRLMSDAVIIPQILPGTYQGIVSGTAGETYPPGTPLSPSIDGILISAQANGVPGANFCGLLTQGAFVPDLDDLVPVGVTLLGPLTLTAAQWEAVTTEGTALVSGDTYYVSAATPGKITHTAPSASGSYVAPVGFALSTTTLLVFTQAPIGPHA